jgi:hypothetical protein
VFEGSGRLPRHLRREQAQDSTADGGQILATAADRVLQLPAVHTPLQRYDPSLAQQERTDVDARRFPGYFAVANHTQHGGVFGGVTPLQIG